jgi:hypothetical protein
MQSISSEGACTGEFRSGKASQWLHLARTIGGCSVVIAEAGALVGILLYAVH